jgi:hypothetical protein
VGMASELSSNGSDSIACGENWLAKNERWDGPPSAGEHWATSPALNLPQI